jgi:hypothetical protein
VSDLIDSRAALLLPLQLFQTPKVVKLLWINSCKLPGLYLWEIVTFEDLTSFYLCFLLWNRGFECFDSRFCGTSVSCWLFKYRVSALAGLSFNMWLIPKSGSLRSFSRSYIRYALGPVHLHRILFASCIFKPILVTWFIMMKGLLLV